MLRAWKESDLVPFAWMNADSRVMEFYPQTMNREESDALGPVNTTCQPRVLPASCGDGTQPRTV